MRIRMALTPSLFLLLALSFSIPAQAQGHGVGTPPTNPPPIFPSKDNPPTADTDNPPPPDPIAREMAKKANLERQAAIKRDTEKLVKLTAELKAYVDKSNENVLSIDVLKKADEIEKLARSVKDKMKGPPS